MRTLYPARAMSGPLADQVTVILLERVAVPLVNRAGSGIWSWFSENVLRRPRAEPVEPSIDFTRAIALRLRDADAITLDLTSTVPSVSIWFEVINHSDVELVLDRIVLELRVGQPVLQGVMAHRYPIPPHTTVSTIWFFELLTEGAMKLISQHQEALQKPGGSVQVLHVTARAYFDSPALRFAIESSNLSRPYPGPESS